MRVCLGIEVLIPRPFHHTHKNKILAKKHSENRFQFFLAYHGFWLSLSWWMVQCGVFVWDIFPLAYRGFWFCLMWLVAS